MRGRLCSRFAAKLGRRRVFRFSLRRCCFCEVRISGSRRLRTRNAIGVCIGKYRKYRIHLEIPEMPVMSTEKMNL